MKRKQNKFKKRATNQANNLNNNSLDAKTNNSSSVNNIYTNIYNPPTPRTKLRGWFHFIFAPIVLISGVALICLAPNLNRKIACFIYLICSLLLFEISGIYHLFNWNKTIKLILRKLDHSNVFLLIAGTYTPWCVSVIAWHGTNQYDNFLDFFFSGKTLLILIWTLCLLAMILHHIFPQTPRLVYVIIYIALGLVCLIYIPTILQSSNPYISTIVILMAAGGFFYITGSIFYATKIPGKQAKVFGFHELFHIFVILGYSCHQIAIWLAIIIP
ncbi:MAG: hemolysin III family protein [Bifidobacteriaceae bacterium]|nr:hemolysin III family protein [Bifidobacteriaceae bacterium]